MSSDHDAAGWRRINFVAGGADPTRARSAPMQVVDRRVQFKLEAANARGLRVQVLSSWDDGCTWRIAVDFDLIGPVCNRVFSETTPAGIWRVELSLPDPSSIPARTWVKAWTNAPDR